MTFARLAFDLSLKALRHSFATTTEAEHYVIASQSQRKLQSKASFSLEGGGSVIQFPGVPANALPSKQESYFYRVIVIQREVYTFGELWNKNYAAENIG